MKTRGIHNKFFSLLNQMPGADKEELVWLYSNMMTTSLREFYAQKPEEYRRMIADLQVKVNQTKKGYTDPSIKMLRSSILHRLQKHGVDTTQWAYVNAFLVQPRIAGKMLFEMDAREMRYLITKLEQILKKDAEIRTREINLSESN